MKKLSLSRIIDFQHLLQAFSQVERVIHRSHKNIMVNENDTEHSYNLAMTAWFLAPHFPHLDRDLLIRHALAHDLVEVHAGDTYIYGSETELATKPKREAEALHKLELEWPDFRDLTAHIHGYVARTTPEAKFIYALDKIMPILLIYINEGYSWGKADVTAKMLYDAKASKTAVSPEIKPYFDQLHELLLQSPHIIRPK
jgi:putative hydrolases of HD superfamily